MLGRLVHQPLDRRFHRCRPDLVAFCVGMKQIGHDFFRQLTIPAEKLVIDIQKEDIPTAEGRGGFAFSLIVIYYIAFLIIHFSVNNPGLRVILKLLLIPLLIGIYSLSVKLVKIPENKSNYYAQFKNDWELKNVEQDLSIDTIKIESKEFKIEKLCN